MDDEPLPLLPVHGLFGSLSDASIVGAFDERRILAPDPIGYGARAGDGWHVPAGIENAARSSVAPPGPGHLMMRESPAAFAAAITEALDGA